MMYLQIAHRSKMQHFKSKRTRSMRLTAKHHATSLGIESHRMHLVHPQAQEDFRVHHVNLLQIAGVIDCTAAFLIVICFELRVAKNAPKREEWDYESRYRSTCVNIYNMILFNPWNGNNTAASTCSHVNITQTGSLIFSTLKRPISEG